MQKSILLLTLSTDLIKVDEEELVNFGKVSVFSENLMKFNELFGIDLNALFGAGDPPKGETDNDLLKKIEVAAEKLIEAAILILS